MHVMRVMRVMQLPWHKAVSPLHSGPPPGLWHGPNNVSGLRSLGPVADFQTTRPGDLAGITFWGRASPAAWTGAAGVDPSLSA